MKQSLVVNPASMKNLYDNFHFAAAARAGDLLVCSGQIGTGPDGRAIEDPAAQFAAAFDNVKAVLAEAGLDFSDVVEITTFHVGLRQHLGTFLQVKDAFMPPAYTAWTAIGVSELAIPGALVEIRATALLRKPAARAGAAKAKPRAAKKRAAKRKPARKR
jgi:enamine deaminase RidA (YjgF/YER057c/UK114 family)